MPAAPAVFPVLPALPVLPAFLALLALLAPAPPALAADAAPAPAPAPAAPIINKWVRPANSDSLASNPANWSLGHAPRTNETIHLSASHPRNITWDAAAVRAVAGWLQDEGYIAVATINTTVPGTVPAATASASAPASATPAFTTLRIHGNLEARGGAITHPRNTDKEDWRLSLDIGGDLIVGKTAIISASGKGFAPGAGPSPPVTPGAGASHGGQGSPHATTPASRPAFTYGSILNPTASGSGGTVSEAAANAYHGGGAIIIKVAGKAGIEGAIRADADSRNFEDDNLGGAAGGSVNLTAEDFIYGSGQISADGGRGWGAGAGGGGGGRVAIISRKNNIRIYSNLITAYGGVGDSKAPENAIADRHIRGAAGTVYTANNDAEIPRSGSVTVRDWHRPSLSGTRIPSDIGSDPGELRDAELIIEHTGFVILSQSTSVRALAFSNGGLDLNANTLSTGSVVDRVKAKTPLSTPGAYATHDAMQFDAVIFNGGRIIINTYFKPIF